MERGDLLERVVEFLGPLQKFLLTKFPGIDLLFQAERIGRPGDQFSRDHRFPNIVRGAARIGRLNIFGFRVRRDDDDGQALQLLLHPDALAGLQSIDLGHFDIHQHQVDSAGLLSTFPDPQEVQPFPRGADREERAEPRTVENGEEQVPLFLEVVDDQNTHGPSVPSKGLLKSPQAA